MRDILIKTASSVFSLRAAALVLHDGKVLLCHYDDRPNTPFWFFPGGKVKLNESTSEAITREFLEEIKVGISCGPLVWLAERFTYTQLTVSHEIALYMRASITDGAVLEQNVAIPSLDDPKLSFQWIELSNVHALNLLPLFAKEALGRKDLSFRHVIERDQGR